MLHNMCEDGSFEYVAMDVSTFVCVLRPNPFELKLLLGLGLHLAVTGRPNM